MDANPHTPTLGCLCGCHALGPYLARPGWRCQSCRHLVTDQRYTRPITSNPSLPCTWCESAAIARLLDDTPVCSVHLKGQ